MSDGYQVDTAQLSAHKGQLQNVAATGDQVVDAGRTVTPGGWDNAYGVACQNFPIAVRPIVDKFLDELDKLVDAVRGTGDAVDQAARQYAQQEQQVKATLDKIGKDLAAGPGGASGSGGGGTTGVGDPMPRIPAGDVGVKGN